MARRIVGAAAAAALTVLPALPAQAGGFCQEGNATNGTGTVVLMKDNCYTPTVLRVVEGAEVVFLNRDTEAHTITAAGGAWSEAHEEIVTDGRKAYRFDQNGIYAYTCLVHPGMTGVIVVGDGSGSGGAATTVDPAELVEAAQDQAMDVADERVSDVEDEAEDTSTIPGLIGGVAVAAGGAAGFGLGRRRRTAE